MPRIVNEVAIGRPAADVFSVLTDVALTARWFPGQVDERWTTPPPLGVGSVRHSVMAIAGTRIETDAVATEFDPPRRAVLESRPESNPRFRMAMDLAADGPATRVTVTSDLDFQGSMRLFGSLAVAPYRHAWDQGLANLKRLMESGAL